MGRSPRWRGFSFSSSPSPTLPEQARAKPSNAGGSFESTPRLISKGSNYGIKVLHDGGIGDTGVDIVFIHGLTGNAFNTWYHKDSDTHWPTELLKIDIPDARILTFGYDANFERFFEPRTVSRLTNHAEELVDQLERLRRRESNNEDDNGNNITNLSSSSRQTSSLSSRKICFVAHSLGGLVTAQALSYSNKSAERHLQQIERCTVSVVFLGVPNCGSDWARWAHLTKKLRWFTGGMSLPRELTNTLRPNSELLNLVQKDFQTLLRQREREGYGISLACLYEKRPIWNNIMVVSQQSASIPGYPSYGVDANHKEMATFADRDDEGYKKIVSELQRWRDLPVREDVESALQKKADGASHNVWNCVNGPNIYGNIINSVINCGGSTQNDIEQPVKPSECIFTIPNRRDADFVCRQRLLDQIHEKSASPASRVALVGLGGVGKTQLAIEYGYQVAERSPDRWILWVYAGSAARVEESYDDIADFLRLPGRKEPKDNTMELVHKWLRNENNGKWLLIVDNIDDSYMQSSEWTVREELERAVVVSGNTRPNMEAFYRYIPQSRNGSVLVTTRNRGLATRMVNENEIIEIEPMIEVEAIDLFTKKLRIKEDVEAIAKLSKILEYMPLAIVQAAAYISERAPYYSTSKYLEEYQERQKDSKINSLFCTEGGRLRRDVDAKTSIVITWIITIEHILKHRHSAAGLLVLMSFFDRQGIPEEAIRARMDFVADAEGHQDEQQSHGQLILMSGGEAFENDIIVLKNYSLIKNINEQSFEMHRMVQNATLDWIEYKGWFDFFQYFFISGLLLGFPNGHNETWAKCRTLFPHVKTTVIQRPKADGTLAEWSCLLIKAARYAYLSGRHRDSECLIKLVLETRVQGLNAVDELTVESFHNAALLYLDQGRWFEAEEVLLQGLEMSGKVWGEKHIVSVNLMGYLAQSYLKQEKWDLARDLQQKVALLTESIANDNEESDGSRNYDRKTPLRGIVSTFNQQENREEKLDCWRGVMEVMNLSVEDNVLEPGEPLINDQTNIVSHLERKRTLNLLAGTLFQQGKYDEALETWNRVLKLLEGEIGEGERRHNPEVSQVKMDKAHTYVQKRDLQRAMDLFEEVLASRRECLDENHTLTVTVMINVAMLKKAFGQFEESKNLFEKAFRLKNSQNQSQSQHQHKSEGNINDDLANLTSKNDLIAVYIELDEWGKAERLHREILEQTIGIYGENDPRTFQCYFMLATYLYRLDRDSEAVAMMRKCHRLRSEVLGAEHADTQLCLTFVKNLEAKMKKDADDKSNTDACAEEDNTENDDGGGGRGRTEGVGEEEEEEDEGEGEKKVASKDKGKAFAFR